MDVVEPDLRKPWSAEAYTGSVGNLIPSAPPGLISSAPNRVIVVRSAGRDLRTKRRAVLPQMIGVQEEILHYVSRGDA